MAQTKAEKDAAKAARVALEKDAKALGVKFTKKTTDAELGELITVANNGEGTPGTGATPPAPTPKGDGPVEDEKGEKTGKFTSKGNKVFNGQGTLVGTEIDEKIAARKADRFNDLSRNK